jgi:hypothetical protein
VIDVAFGRRVPTVAKAFDLWRRAYIIESQQGSNLQPYGPKEQAEITAVDHALSAESDAFGRGDLSALGQCCNVPFVVISSEGVKVLRTMSEIAAFWGASSDPSESVATRIAHGRSCM